MKRAKKTEELYYFSLNLIFLRKFGDNFLNTSYNNHVTDYKLTKNQLQPIMGTGFCLRHWCPLYLTFVSSA